MARLDISGMDKVISDMQRLGENSGPVAEAMVDAAAAVTRDAWKETAEEYRLHDSGDMINSINFTMRGVGSGLGVLTREIYPQGTDSKGVRNAEKAYLLHYGTSRIKAKYWVDDAEERADQRVVPVMEQIWGEYLETGNVPAAAPGVASGSGISTRKT